MSTFDWIDHFHYHMWRPSGGTSKKLQSKTGRISWVDMMKLKNGMVQNEVKHESYMSFYFIFFLYSLICVKHNCRMLSIVIKVNVNVLMALMACLCADGPLSTIHKQINVYYTPSAFYTFLSSLFLLHFAHSLNTLMTQ